MAITTLPDPPSRGDPTNFAQRADAFMAALPQFAEEANALQVDVNAKQQATDGAAAAAQESKNAAAASEVNAASSKTAAKASELLAKDWATKTGVPVDGAEFSAKHYAQLAAAGMGLPVMATVPVPNVGPVYVIDLGVMQWNSSASAYELVVLPIFPAAPTADQGPIYVPGQGPMEWNSVAGMYVAMSGGASGGGGEKVFYKNQPTMAQDYTIEAGENAMVTGPLEITGLLTVEGALVIL